MFFKMQFVQNVLVHVSGVITFSFCYCFYEGFIHKIILVSQFYLKFVSAIRSKSLDLTLPQSKVLLCLILFFMFACNNFPFCAFVTMIYWTSTEVLLNLTAPLDSAASSLDFEQINIFLTSSFDSVSIAFDSLSVSRRIQELHFSHSIQVFLLLTLRESIYGSWL